MAIHQQMQFATAVIPSGPSPPLDGTSPTAAFSMSRNMLSTFSGSFYTNTSGEVSSWTDQTGNGRHFTSATSGQRPTASTAGPLSRACADFDGTNDKLAGVPWQSLLSSTSKFIVASAILDTVSASTDTTYVSTGHWIIGDDGGIVMLNASVDASVKKMFAAFYPGSGSSTRVGTAITEGTMYVFTLRHDSGNLYLGINGVETSVGAGTTYTGSNQTTYLGNRTGNAWLDGKLFELATFSTVPTSGQRSALITNMMAYVGAV